jgi:hypothetical protein
MDKWLARMWTFAMWLDFTLAVANSFAGHYDRAAMCAGFACFAALQLVLGKLDHSNTTIIQVGSGYLTVPAKLSPDDIARIRDAFTSRVHRDV